MITKLIKWKFKQWLFRTTLLIGWQWCKHNEHVYSSKNDREVKNKEKSFFNAERL